MALLSSLLYFCIFQILPIFAHITTKKCLPSHKTLINIEDQFNIQIENIDYNITYNYNFKLVELHPGGVTQIYFEKADVNISALLYPKEKYEEFKMARKLNAGFFTVNRTVKNRGTRNEEISCKIIQSDQLFEGVYKTIDSMTTRERAKFSVQALIVNCLEIQICEQYDMIISHDFLERNKMEENVNKAIRNYMEQKKAKEENKEKEKNLQVAINSFFDFGVSIGISKMTDENGTFHVPKVQKDFTYLSITGNFIATDASVDGLNSLKRTAAVTLTNDKNRYTISTTVRIPVAKVNVPYYYARYGFKEIEGHLIVNVQGASLAIKVTVDYNGAPCKIQLDEMNIHEVGDIDVNFAGLGYVWDKLAFEPLIRYTIRNYLFEKGRESIAEQASKFNCEKYRPTFDIQNNN